MNFLSQIFCSNYLFSPLWFPLWSREFISWPKHREAGSFLLMFELSYVYQKVHRHSHDIIIDKIQLFPSVNVDQVTYSSIVQYITTATPSISSFWLYIQWILFSLSLEDRLGLLSTYSLCGTLRPSLIFSQNDLKAHIRDKKKTRRSRLTMRPLWMNEWMAVSVGLLVGLLVCQ